MRTNEIIFIKDFQISRAYQKRQNFEDENKRDNSYTAKCNRLTVPLRMTEPCIFSRNKENNL